MIRTIGTAKLNGSHVCLLLAAAGLAGCSSMDSSQSGGDKNSASLGIAAQAEKEGKSDAGKSDSKESKACKASDASECELPDSDNSSKTLTIAVYGDAPYGTTPTDTSETVATPAFIQAVNADPSVSLVVHVGDIHSGKQYCTQSYDQTVFDMWTAYSDPLVYTPGDNEWTDCNKSGEGGGVNDSSGNPVDYAGGDPLANLSLIRSMFFAKPGLALGGGCKHVLSQSQCRDKTHPTDAKFVENVMWKDSGVLFVTINLPGGSNNDHDIWFGSSTVSAAQAQEITERTNADLHWLDAAFAQAKHENTAGVVIVAQADMWDPEKGAAHQTEFEPFVKSIADHTAAFGKPVLMFNGDSHVYQTSNPLSATATLAYMHPADASLPRYDVPNFHRVVVHGSTMPLEYLRLTIDRKANAPHGTEAYGPFSWTRVIPFP